MTKGEMVTAIERERCANCLYYRQFAYYDFGDCENGVDTASVHEDHHCSDYERKESEQ